MIILRAEGPVFSSGLNLDFLDVNQPGGLHSLLAQDDERLDASIEVFQRAFRWWREVPAITICVVAGPAVGAGFQLALATDLRVITREARFAMREIALGLVPDLGGTGRLLDLVGYPRALEICATGRWVDAAEATALGIADRHCESRDLEETLEKLVASLLEHDPLAVSAVKKLLNSVVASGSGGSFAAERQAQLSRLRSFGKA